MDNYKKLKVPVKYAPMMKAFLEADSGYKAVLAPGYYYTPEKGHSIHADTEKSLFEKLFNVEKELFDLIDDEGKVQSTLEPAQAISLLPHLRLDYTIVSHATNEQLEDIDTELQRKQICYMRYPQRRGTVLYYTGNYSVELSETGLDNGDIMLSPSNGQRAATWVEWEKMPKPGLNAFCKCLERQIRREKAGTQDKEPLVWLSGDRNHPLMDELLKLNAERPDAFGGLIELIPAEAGDIIATGSQGPRPQYLKALREISNLLQINGYEDAAKFLCHGLEVR